LKRASLLPREEVSTELRSPVAARSSLERIDPDEDGRELPRSNDELGREGVRVGGRDSRSREAAGGADRRAGSEEPARSELGDPRSKVAVLGEVSGSGVTAEWRLPLAKGSSGRGSRW
jgi:hypothetical protein